MSEVITVESVAEFTNEICQLEGNGTYDELMQRTQYLFRGQASINYQLVPSIARNGKNLYLVERNVIEGAKHARPDIFSNALQPVELLALLQHHGIPTRLLDVTENALIALFVACSSKNDKEAEADGEVLAFEDKRLNIATFPLENGIADMYRLFRSEQLALDELLEDMMQQPYFLEQKAIVKRQYPTREAKIQWISKFCQKPHFIDSPFYALRQQIQGGHYLLFANIIEPWDGGRFANHIDPLCKNDDCIRLRLLIPADKKAQILADLKMFGISNGKLFCDNIDEVCKEIKETYFDNAGKSQ